ncbi:uncharacterized protein F4822DRAFT_433387 [Hypoxylon trugodes]|uniref:uncharacterized protein n=1 Tax=Hypoxylon trugodes TaxID=326681 RepID=UPI00219B3D9B|nr:uncharacterized protein F4822DRAFT_433387 [Hypoxylon trugodes]KAI1384848.1 hypothetical protein F4822DRAFT_433387 [Hypoxylon trugodes]
MRKSVVRHAKKYLHRPHFHERPENSEASNSSRILVDRKKENRTPLAIEILDRLDSVDPQLESPLFAKLPREVRELIWGFALTRYEDLDNLYRIDERYTRPGQAAPLRVNVGLLHTCRAVYIEAFLTPFQVNPIVAYDGNHKDIPPANVLTHSVEDMLFCRKLKYWQLANISSVEITVQQINLESAALERLSRLVGTLRRHHGHECKGYTPAGYADFEPSKTRKVSTVSSQNPLVGRKITHLSVRMARTDWWSWESAPEYCATNPSDRLRIEPAINVTNLAAQPENSLAMTRGYEARLSGKEPDFDLEGFEKLGRWGFQIQEYWPDLTKLDLVLETFACKQNQLDYVIKCAKLWKFPVEQGYHLVWNGKDEVTRWLGAHSYQYEMGRSWFKEQNRARKDDNPDLPPKLKWRPAGAYDGDPADAQEFIIRTLTFERKRDEDRPRSA